MRNVKTETHLEYLQGKLMGAADNLVDVAAQDWPERGSAHINRLHTIVDEIKLVTNDLTSAINENDVAQGRVNT